MLKIKIEKSKNKPTTYCGKVVCTENGQYLWSESTKIERLTKDCARLDAQKLLNHINEINKLV